MKILLFTPAIKLSAIGRMTRLVSLALVSLGYEVVIVRTETTALLETPTHDFGADILRWDDHERVEEAIAEADGIVYQIGNHYDFHYGCLEWMIKRPGVVCLHDIYLGHLFYGWAQGRRAEAHRHVASWYGEPKADEFFAYQDSESFLKGTCDSAPMTEWICSMAYGVITHSSWGIKRILESCPGPVRVAALAYDKPEIPIDSGDARDLLDKKFKILTIGHINPNKRIESVINAIGKSNLLRTNTTYILAGSIQPATAAYLSELSAQLGVELVISGEVDDATLDRTITSADLISCLRWPSLEAASASAIEAMLYGKAVIVTNTGFYTELPDEVVRKINHENEVAELQATFEALYDNPDARNELGARAQDWASKTFTPLNYANELIHVVVSASAVQPVIDACRTYVSVLRTWGASPEIIESGEMTAALGLFAE